MDTFLQLLIPEFSPPGCSSGTPPDENEIRSPTSYIFRSKSRKCYHRQSLQFDTIIETTEDQLDHDISSIDSAQEENKSNSSFNKDLEELKIYMIHHKTVHSSPKLVTSHFEDSGFLNYSSEMTPRLETIEEIHSSQEDKSSGHDVSIDSYLQGELDRSHSWLKVDENSYINGNFIAKSGDPNSKKYFSDESKPLNDQFIAEMMNVHDSKNSIEICQTHEQSSTIADNAREYGGIAEKIANVELND